MIVFITNPKYFDKRKIAKKRVDLVYIFGSKELFDDLSKKYKCVNIIKNGAIKNENFFPDAVKYKKVTKERFLLLKISALSYFRKKRDSFYKRHYEMLHFKDPLFNLNVAMAKKKRDFNEGVKIIDGMIIKYINDIFKVEKGDDFLKSYSPYIDVLLNLSHSLYRAYIYANGFKRGYEVFGDIFKYNFFSKAALYYTFDRFDIYEDRFHYNYLKVLSRLFIEDIHKHNIVKFIDRQIEYYKEEGWL